MGIHPWDAASADISTMQRLSDGIQAIGEIGLDFASAVPKEIQYSAFRSQLAIAQQRGLPVVLHCVRAFNEVMLLLKETPPPIVIFHGFIGSVQQAAQALRQGYYLSFGLRTFSSPRTQEVLRTMPLGRLFLETDDADISIEEIYEKTAHLRQISIVELQQNIQINYERIFRK